MTKLPSNVRILSPNLAEWDIYLLPTPAKFLGLVEATDAESAISEAVWRFDVKEPSKLRAVRRR